jgi:NAD-dependent oxidoreductase involved in siderophore biosynthesis
MSPRQRPTLQTANVLNKVALSVQVNMKADPEPADGHEKILARVSFGVATALPH